LELAVRTAPGRAAVLVHMQSLFTETKSPFLHCLKLPQNSHCAALVCARNQKSCCWDICITYCHVWRFSSYFGR